MIRTKKTQIIVLALIIALVVIFLVKPHKKIVNYVADKKAETYLINIVGEEYYRNNFRLKATYMGTTLPPIVDSKTKYYKYIFLPFSTKYEYVLTINVDTTNGEVSADLPACVYENPANRCNLPFKYAEIYERALEKLGDGNISIKLVEKEQKFKWQIIKTEGDPYCAPNYKSYFIDAGNGSETPIKDKKSNWCI